MNSKERVKAAIAGQLPERFRRLAILVAWAARCFRAGHTIRCEDGRPSNRLAGPFSVLPWEMAE
jgi:hypothetical protein